MLKVFNSYQCSKAHVESKSNISVSKVFFQVLKKIVLLDGFQLYI